MQSTLVGSLRKMHTQLTHDGQVEYRLPIGEHRVDVNALLGKNISLTFNQQIHCIHCGRSTNKSFNQGYCYPCFQSLAQCDSCIVSPEKCHYHQGTCRDTQWADEHCMTHHVVYLANTSRIKVGITRASQVPTRFIDQGASQALPIIAVQTRQQSGFAEVIFKQLISDKTHWQAMLKAQPQPIDLERKRNELLMEVNHSIRTLQDKYGLLAINPILQGKIYTIKYPVLEYPEKVKSVNLDKNTQIGGRLLGVKGQYLILTEGVINIRRHAGYHISLQYS